jgi:hypothetical protein
MSGHVESSSEHGNLPSGCVKGRKVLGQWRDSYQYIGGKKEELWDFECCSKINQWKGVIILFLCKVALIEPCFLT